MDITEKQIVSYIGGEAHYGRYWGANMLPQIDDLFNRFPNHKRTIQTVYEILSLINGKVHSESGISPGIPSSDLLCDAVRTHNEFISTMPVFFGLQSCPIEKIPVRFEDKTGKGLFSYETGNLEIILDPNSRNWPSYLDFLFTVAHESAHYLHFLRRPSFYHDLRKFKIEEALSHRDHREFVADAGAFDFFRKTGRLNRFIEEEKTRKLPRFSSNRYSCQNVRWTMSTLINSAIYRDAFQKGTLPKLVEADIYETNPLNILNTELSRVRDLFGQDFLLGAWQANHLSFSPSIFEEIKQPSLFDAS